MNKYVTRNGELLDEIIFKYYGSVSFLEKVLESNRHLAKLGPILPEDIGINLPDLEKIESPQKEVVIWD